MVNLKQRKQDQKTLPLDSTVCTVEGKDKEVKEKGLGECQVSEGRGICLWKFERGRDIPLLAAHLYHLQYGNLPTSLFENYGPVTVTLNGVRK